MSDIMRNECFLNYAILYMFSSIVGAGVVTQPKKNTANYAIIYFRHI